MALPNEHVFERLVIRHKPMGIGILEGTKYRNAPAQFAPAEGVSQEVSAPMPDKSIPNSTTESIPYGYCHCGCGEKTRISDRNDSTRGWTRGAPRRFQKGHHIRVNHPNRPKPPSRIQWSDVDKCWHVELSQGAYALVDDADIDAVRAYRWFAQRNTTENTAYARTYIDKKMVPMHRLIAAAPLGTEVDHVNRNGLDNRRSNLRLCTSAENRRNVPARRGSSSQYKGVYWHKGHRKWVAQIRANKRTFRIGEFDCEVDAAKAYDRMAKQYHGEFAFQNFPKEGE